ncbi:amino acid adenylation domain-containing protein, partial [Streptomyces pacificus]|uniref:amino acid adenylation domain-containing protein n=1 Tax=Streptomyces pacificus TaxID=2705029 RepID=UPI0020B171D0
MSCGGEWLSYGELEVRAGVLAARLRGLGVGVETPVGVCVGRSVNMVVAALGVLKAGGVYVPLDPGLPAGRMAFMLGEVGVSLVVVEDAVVPVGPWGVVDLAGVDWGGSVGGLVGGVVVPGNAAYVIFTSGSTGRPKGVVVSHGSVTRLVGAAGRGLGLGVGDVWSLFHSFAFDFSVWEMWGALSTGGRLVVVPGSVVRDAVGFLRLLGEEGVTVLSQTPSAFEQLERADRECGVGLALRVVVFGGEVLRGGAVRRWVERHGWDVPRLVNMYGITEATVHVSRGVVGVGDVGGVRTCVGRPLGDVRVFVVDGFGVLCPVGVVGEVLVGGPGVARGYVGRAALTADRFVPDHLSGLPGERLYRSGDLACWNARGVLEYAGRVDAQVKVRGHRVEPGEVEAVLEGHPGVLRAAVVARADGDGDGVVSGDGDGVGVGGVGLVAYVVAGGGVLVVDELRAFLGRMLPSYMVPRRFVVLEALPLTAQGKTDYR